MAISATVRRWGNSLGVILPKDFIDSHQIVENEKIVIEVVKEANIKHLFGSQKRVMSGQDFKDMVREGWK